MKYLLTFLAVGILFCLAAWRLGGVGWVCLWPGLSFLVVAAAYAGLGPRIFGKRSDGRLAWWSVIALLPFLAATWTLWHLRRVVKRELCCHQVAPGVWLGRRPVDGEVPAGVKTIVDLTCEFSESRRAMAGRRYLCLPTLDNSVPEASTWRSVMSELARAPGDVYIHCAAGRGRSALAAVAVMIQRGHAADPAEAVEKLCRVRPGVTLNRRQLRFLRQMLPPEAGGAGKPA